MTGLNAYSKKAQRGNIPGLYKLFGFTSLVHCLGWKDGFGGSVLTDALDTNDTH